MLVLDSNVWIYIATAENRPVEVFTESRGVLDLFEDFLSGTYDTVVTPYMMREVHDGCKRSDRVSDKQANEALTRFYGIVKKCASIIIREDDVYSESMLSVVRNRPHNQLLSQLLGVQTKDVPVLTIAYDYYHRNPLVLTDDSGFGRLDTAAAGLPNITIEELNLTW